MPSGNHHRHHRPAPVRQYSRSSYRRPRHSSTGDYSSRHYNYFDDLYISSPPPERKSHRHHHHHGSERHHKTNKSPDIRGLEERLRRLKTDSPLPSEYFYEDRKHRENKDGNHYSDNGYHERYYPDKGEEDEEYEGYLDAGHDSDDDYPYYSDGERRELERHVTFLDQDYDRDQDRDRERERERERSQPPLVTDILIGLASDIMGEFTRNPLFHSHKSRRKTPPSDMDDDERVRTLTPSPESSADEAEGNNAGRSRKSTEESDWESEPTHRYGTGSIGKGKEIRGVRKDSVDKPNKNSLGPVPGYTASFPSPSPPPPQQPTYFYSEPLMEQENGRQSIPAAPAYPSSTHDAPYRTNPKSQNYSGPVSSNPPFDRSMFAQYGYNQIPQNVWRAGVANPPPPPSAEVSPMSHGIDPTPYQHEGGAGGISAVQKSNEHTSSKDDQKLRTRKRHRHKNGYGSRGQDESDLEPRHEDHDEEDEPYPLIRSPKSFSDIESTDSYDNHRYRKKHGAKGSKSSRHKGSHRSKSGNNSHLRGGDLSPYASSRSPSPRSRSLSRSRYDSSTGDRATNRDLQRYPDVPKKVVERLEHKHLAQQILPLLEAALEIIDSLNETITLVTGGYRRTSLAEFMAPFVMEKYKKRNRRGSRGDSEFGVMRAWAMVRTLRRISKHLERRRRYQEKERQKKRKERDKRKKEIGKREKDKPKDIANGNDHQRPKEDKRWYSRAI